MSDNSPEPELKYLMLRYHEKFPNAQSFPQFVRFYLGAKYQALEEAGYKSNEFIIKKENEEFEEIPSAVYENLMPIIRKKLVKKLEALEKPRAE